jgi:cation:H+ antiporter
MITLLHASSGTFGGNELLMPVLLLGGGLALLLVSAHFLVDFAKWAAQKYGVSQLTIGLTVIAFGTSTPELALNVVSAASGESGAKLAFGNVVGSNIANIGLVLAVACLVRPVLAARNIRYVYYPLLVGTEILLLVLATFTREITWVDGVILLAALPIAVYILHAIASRLDSDEAEVEGAPSTRHGLTIAALLILSLFMLLAGAKLAEVGAVKLAHLAGLTEAAIGLTVVAIATSLPESFTAIIAAKRGQSDLAMGTVLGSNVFNILSVLAITSIVAGSVPIPESLGWTSLGGMMFFTLAIAPIYYKNQRNKRKPPELQSKGTGLGRLWGGIMLACWIGLMVFFVTTGTNTKAQTQEQTIKSASHLQPMGMSRMGLTTKLGQS